MGSDEAGRALREHLALFRARSAAIALEGLDQIDARAATLFRKNGILDFDGSLEVSESLRAALEERVEPAGLGRTPGPLLGFEDESGQPSVCEVSHLLLNDERYVRELASNYFLKSVLPESGAIGGYAYRVVAEDKDALLSEDAQVWQRASIAALDALRADILLSIAGVRQSINAGFDDGVNNFLTRALRPAVDSLRFLEVTGWNPGEQGEEIAEGVAALVSHAESLSEALEEYRGRFGFVPLGRTFGAGRLVSLWMEQRDVDSDLWEVVWRWAETSRGALSRYHACEVFLSNPELIPNERWGELWGHVTAVATMGRGGAGADEAEEWEATNQAAQHFCLTIEANSPGVDSRGIAAAAWFLADRLVSCFAKSADVLRAFREQALEPEISTAAEIWRMSRTPVQGSQIRFATLGIPSMWSHAILARVGEQIPELRIEKSSVEQREMIARAFGLMVVAGFPPADVAASPEGLAYEGSACAAAGAWLDAVPESDQKSELAALVSLATKLHHPDGFEERIRSLGDAGVGDRAVLIHQLRVKAYCGHPAATLLWECISDDRWRRSLLQEADESTVQLMVDAALESCRGDARLWRNLPHFFALEAQSCSEEERRELLFGAAVAASFATDAVSALDRLLRTGASGSFIELVRPWRQRVDLVRRGAPAWIAGRARRISAALRPGG